MNSKCSPNNSLTLPYQALRESMLGFLNKHVNDPAIAEDLLQEVFLKALKANEKGKSPDNLAGWLYGIAKNTVIDFYRAKRPTHSLPDDLIAESVDQTFSEKTLSHCLRPMIERLPTLSKKTLLEIYFNGKTMQNLADEEKAPISTIKNRAFRGRELLRKSLLECCHIEVSQKGEILDYNQEMKASDCQSKSCQ